MSFRYEETKFQSEVPFRYGRKRELLRRPVTITWYRATDGVHATGWTPFKTIADEGRCSRPSAERLWDRGSIHRLSEDGK
jgi:hypothetical protein